MRIRYKLQIARAEHCFVWYSGGECDILISVFYPRYTAIFASTVMVALPNLPEGKDDVIRMVLTPLLSCGSIGGNRTPGI